MTARTERTGTTSRSSKGKWTDDEDEALRKAIVEDNVQVYHLLANGSIVGRHVDLKGKVDGRSPAACWDRIKLIVKHVSEQNDATNETWKQIANAVDRQYKVGLTHVMTKSSFEPYNHIVID